MKRVLRKVIDQAKKHRIGLGASAVLVVAMGWYLFRPELLFINASVDEAFPVPRSGGASSAEPAVLSTGRFHGVAHAGKGTATIYQFADGKRVLRLTEFETSNGPALHVRLVAVADAADNETVKKAEAIDLGALKGNLGDQNYDVPGEVDVAKYRAVTIWCQRFSVNFATAPLMLNEMETTAAHEPDEAMLRRR